MAGLAVGAARMNGQPKVYKNARATDPILGAVVPLENLDLAAHADKDFVVTAKDVKIGGSATKRPQNRKEK